MPTDTIKYYLNQEIVPKMIIIIKNNTLAQLLFCIMQKKILEMKIHIEDVSDGKKLHGRPNGTVGYHDNMDCWEIWLIRLEDQQATIMSCHKTYLSYGKGQVQLVPEAGTCQKWKVVREGDLLAFHSPKGLLSRNHDDKAELVGKAEPRFRFLSAFLNKRKVSLSHGQMFLSATPKATVTLANEKSETETWTQFCLPTGRRAFMSYYKTFLRSCPDQIDLAPDCWGWQKWDIEQISQAHFYIRGHHGDYLSGRNSNPSIGSHEAQKWSINYLTDSFEPSPSPKQILEILSIEKQK